MLRLPKNMLQLPDKKMDNNNSMNNEGDIDDMNNNNDIGMDNDMDNNNPIYE